MAAADREGKIMLKAKLRQANSQVTANTEMYGKHNFNGEKFIDSDYKTPSHNPNHPNPIIRIKLTRNEINFPQNIWDRLTG